MMQYEKAICGIDVSRETMEKLKLLEVLITKWTSSINLIAPKSVADLWSRHIEDSAQIYAISPKNWTHWVDLGSGGGLPALVVAILDPKQQRMTLVESDQRKCQFLRTARRELSLNIIVENVRIESASIDQADILSARALAPLTDLLEYATKMLSPEGIALFSKGVRYEDELEQAKKSWHFDVKSHQSQTSEESRILEISRIRRREP